MCIDTVSLPNVSWYGDISIYCCISKPDSFLYVQECSVIYATVYVRMYM